jgi:hypothetical protein
MEIWWLRNVDWHILQSESFGVVHLAKFWTIWNERNALVFQSKQGSTVVLLDKIKK